MTIRTATSCTHPPCRRSTTDVSGRCFDHRGGASAPGVIATIAPSPAVDPDVPTVIRLADGGYEVCHYQGGVLHRIDGPAYERQHADGSVTEEWWVEGERRLTEGLADELLVGADSRAAG